MCCHKLFTHVHGTHNIPPMHEDNALFFIYLYAPWLRDRCTGEENYTPMNLQFLDTIKWAQKVFLALSQGFSSV